MKKQWKNINVDLNLLAEKIQNIYTKKRLKTKTTTTQKRKKIYILPGQTRHLTVMDITITGTPNNFTIETKASEYEDEAVKVGLATTLFGGGYIIFSSIKAREELEKLEKEFWTNIEEIIAPLANTASR